MSLLEIDRLAVVFHTKDTPFEAVSDASLRVESNQTAALVGESGSGKSVTALSVLRLLPYPLASHPRGEIRFHGKDLLSAPMEHMRTIRGGSISIIFQEPMTSLNPLHTVEKQVSESLIVHQGLNHKQARERTIELLHMVQLSDVQHRLDAWPHQLSGGQRQRVMIAMALANEPELLIADEPTTALDVTIQAQIFRTLQDLQRQLGMAILLITHDLSIVRKLADEVFVMTAGRVVERGPTPRIFRTPNHPYTKRLLGAEPTGDPAPHDPTAPILMHCEQLRVWFPIKRGLLNKTVDHVKAVDGINIQLHAAETLGVVGESGSGKSSLGLALLRLVRSHGSITLEGREIQGLTNRQLRPLRRDMQIVFQDPYGSLSPRFSAAHIVEEGLSVQGIRDAHERRRIAANAFAEVGLDLDLLDRFPHEFSGGQRQRIAIARALVLRPKILILDEPTSALDVTMQAEIIELLLSLQKQHGLTYLFITHDLKVMRAMASQVMVMRHGKVVESGDAEKIFKAPRTEYTRQLVAAAKMELSR